MLPGRFRVDVAAQVRTLNYALQFGWILYSGLKTMNEDCQMDCGP